MWYRRAADGGSASAQYNLAWMHEKGRGVGRVSRAEALSWYEKAAAQGHEDATKAVARLSKIVGRQPTELVLHGYRNPLSKIDAASWNTITGAEVSRITKDLSTRFPASGLSTAAEVSIAEKSLAAYDDLRFLEVKLQREEGDCFGYFLWSPDEFVPLNGVSIPLHELNARKKLDVFSRESAREYIYMFVNTLTGDKGRFLLVDEIGDLPFSSDIDEGTRAALEDGLVPLAFVEPEWDETTGKIESFRFNGTVLHGRGVFSAQFRFWTTGMVEMLDDVPVRTDLPIVTDLEVQLITLK